MGAILGAMFLAPLALTAPEPVTMTLVPTGATRRAGGYSPMRAEMSATPTSKCVGNLTAPMYGEMTFGTRKIAFALSEPTGADGDATLVIDANGNGDLSDDAPVPFGTKQGMKVRFGEATVDLGKGQPVGVQMYRFDPADPARAAFKTALFYYADYGYQLGFRLDGKPYTVFVAGDPGPETSFGIDRNGDGATTSPRETIEIGQPFNFTGTTYRFVPSGTGLVLEKPTRRLPVEPLPPSFAVGRRALPIRATALDGNPVDLMKDYKGKLVMLDFWATWCGPCVAELPNVKAAYAKYHGQGFDVLGVSFDEANFADKLKSFTKERGMPWRQVYEGKGWSTKTGSDYDVNSIPFTLLVDGDTGKILGDASNLRGPGLSDFIAKKLAEKKATKTSK